MENFAEFDYRVWPDGTVQCTEDGDPYSWMSDDFMVVKAGSEDEALVLATAKQQANPTI